MVEKPCRLSGLRLRAHLLRPAAHCIPRIVGLKPDLQRPGPANVDNDTAGALWLRGGSRVRIETFSTDNVPQIARGRHFQREMERRFSLGLVIEAASEVPLSARVTAYCGRRLRFAELEFSPHRTHYSPPQDNTPGRLMVCAHKQGSGIVSQSGRSSPIEAGQMVVIDPAQPFS